MLKQPHGMDRVSTEIEQLMEKYSIGLLILLLTLTFLLGLVFGYVISLSVLQSGSMTVVPSSKGDLLICPKPQQKRSVAKVYAV
jgi:hypothetical protein